jgi:hypothetical protein
LGGELDIGTAQVAVNAAARVDEQTDRLFAVVFGAGFSTVPGDHLFSEITGLEVPFPRTLRNHLEHFFRQNIDRNRPHGAPPQGIGPDEPGARTALILTKPALKYTRHAVLRSAARIRRLGERRWLKEKLQGSVGTPHSEGALALFDLCEVHYNFVVIVFGIIALGV